MDKISKLKAELAALENRPVQSATKPMTDLDTERINALFAEALRERPLPEPTDHVCDQCFKRQPLSNSICELCCETPSAWLPAHEREPKDLQACKAWSQRKQFIEMANDYTFDRLETAARSGWASTPEREKFIAKLLRVRASERPPAPIPVPEIQRDGTPFNFC
jgi:hypothetical protein